MKRKRNTGKPVKIGETRPLWNSEIFYSQKVTRDKKGKKIAETKPRKYLVLTQPETEHPTRFRDFAFIELYTPTPETLAQNITHNKNLELSESLTEKETTELSNNLGEILKFSNPDFSIKTRPYAKSVIIAKRRSELIIRGKLSRRTIKRVETTPPDYETFKVCEGFSYRFYFRNNATNKTVIRDIKTNRARVHPTRKIYYPTPSGFKAVKILLPLNKIVQLKPIKTVIYEIELKQGYKINTDFDTHQPLRTNAKTQISIDYKQLAKAEKRISKKWFKLLTDSLKDENLISDLTPHLKKLRNKIVTSRAVTPNTLRAQRPITSRISTVTEYNHKLRIDTVANTHEMKARKLGITKRKITVDARALKVKNA